mmetsp:Transcript_8625/g.18409  ORF Transcript_8625/g.18409 Transcript_8625/m.18409 type:complete len:153 (+) Transcript_8625:24-482(+)
MSCAFVTGGVFVRGGVAALARSRVESTRRVVAGSARVRMMATEIVPGVSFDTIAREWRFKWSADNDKKSLEEAQKVLDEALPKLKALDGIKDVQRVVCGGCLDFKVITSLSADKYGDWEAAGFAPEEDFLGKVKAIDGISTVETQTFTIMPM